MMRTLRRYLFVQIAAVSALVLLVFLGLLFFLDFVNDLSDGGAGHAFGHALLVVTLQLPGRAYEVLPIAVLTGTVYVLASLAASSEFTVMRMSGLSPGKALRQLIGLGLCFTALLFVLGELVVPASERLSASLQASAQGGHFDTEMRSGLWLRNRLSGQDDQMINIGRVAAGGELRDVRIYVLDGSAHLVQAVSARRASYQSGGSWLLRDVTSVDLASLPDAPLRLAHLPTLAWQTSVSPGMLDVLLLSTDNMSALDLWRYVDHLKANGQAVQRDETALWRKLLYPFSAIVMMMLALPFAYLHARSGQVSWKVFGGIMLGISFILVNTLAAHLGILASWPGWLAAALPYLLYGGLALGAFFWRVQYR
jgi:lipopolysaccharide export system permease protein